MSVKPDTSTAYQLGYLAAVAGKRRHAPSKVRRVIPNHSKEWFRGYDDAESDNEAERAAMLASFSD